MGVLAVFKKDGKRMKKGWPLLGTMSCMRHHDEYDMVSLQYYAGRMAKTIRQLAKIFATSPVGS